MSPDFAGIVSPDFVHVVSPKHLSRYLDEMTWRFDRREEEDGSRLNSLLAFADDRRLTYKALIA